MYRFWIVVVYFVVICIIQFYMHLTPSVDQDGGSHAARYCGRVVHPLLAPGGPLVLPFWQLAPLVK